MPGGAPEGNQNATKHGLRSGRMALSDVPAGCSRIRAVRSKLRSALELLTLEVRGQVGVYEAALIQTACRWETHARLAARWLRIGKDLTLADKLALSKAIAYGSEKRDLCLKALGLDQQARDTIGDWYKQPLTLEAEEDPEPTEATQDAHSGV